MLELFPFLIGLLGSLHCLGMCGPLVLAYSLHMNDGVGASSIHFKNGFFHHAAFHCGRLITYGALGALAAGLFQAADIGRFYSAFRGTMSIFGGVLLLLLGLALLKAVPLPAFLVSSPLPLGSFLRNRAFSLLHSRRAHSKLFLGLVAGLMPCCLLWATIVTAATTQDPIKGFATMISFGLGTIPALFLTGVSASLISRRIRSIGEMLAAVSILGVGIILILRGAGILA